MLYLRRYFKKSKNLQKLLLYTNKRYKIGLRKRGLRLIKASLLKLASS